jgi:2-polyprenyl-3-methyl-5-hydroxy-6-metoxy-1,4-benzoquinol methylase
MYVYSNEQFRTLLDLPKGQSSTFQSLLDIGAADGSVTDQMSDEFQQVYVTELSPTMRWRLSRKGYTVLDADEWGNRTFDVITCLNVLDRCDRPISLLKQIRRYLNPDQGQLIISMVLPYRQYFEYNRTHRPQQTLRFSQMFSNHLDFV